MKPKYLEHIADLHRRAFTVDAHFDLTYDVANRREHGERKVVEDYYLPQFNGGNFNLLVSAIFIDDVFLPEMGLRKALDQISCLHEEIDESPGKFRICRTTSEACAAQAAGELAIFLSLEGADPLQNDLKLLRIFYELGVRGLGLVWSRRNYAADGSFFTSVREGRKGGLTPFGIELIEAAEKLGMFIDVSHLNDEGFWDVIDVVTKPLIASHSNCRSLAGSMRNLTDDQIKAIAKTGGVVGMNAINVFVRDQGWDATISHFVDHVDHIINLVGDQHVGIGFDLCDSHADFMKMVPALESKDIIDTHAGLGEFTQELIIRGYSDNTIIAILGGNFMRVFAEILD
ncbi:MAG: dipeptidase [Desulfuromusa sp.]